MCIALPAAMPGSRQEEVIDHRLTEREWAEEWKHLNSVSICDSQNVCTPLDPKAWGGEQNWVQHHLSENREPAVCLSLYVSIIVSV